MSAQNVVSFYRVHLSFREIQKSIKCRSCSVVIKLTSAVTMSVDCECSCTNRIIADNVNLGAEVLFRQDGEDVWASVSSSVLKSLVEDAATTTCKQIQDALFGLNSFSISCDEDMRQITGNTKDVPEA